MGIGVKGLVTATAFLTRLPMPQASPNLAGAWVWFPVVGGGIGALVGSVVLAGLAMGIPALVAATVAVGVSLLVTGALHEDSLADTFDGMGSGRRGAEAIEIMRDSRIGTFGSAALLFSLSVQITTLATISRELVLLAAISAHAASRGFAVLVLHIRPASDTGLAAGAASTTRFGTRILACLLGIVIAAVALRGRAWALLPAILLGSLLVWWAHRRIGGITGDVIGAVQQVTLFTILVGATVP